MNIDLRDYFAGQALAGLLAANDLPGEWSNYTLDAYLLADAMIAEKKKTDKPKEDTLV